MSAECLHCAAPGCCRNEPQIGQIIWKTASFTFQFQVRKGIQHLSHFSLSGAHHPREVQVHPSPCPCRSNSSQSAAPHSREIPAESMGENEVCPGRESSRLCPQVCCTNSQSFPSDLQEHFCSPRFLGSCCSVSRVFELFRGSVYTSGFFLSISLCYG